MTSPYWIKIRGIPRSAYQSYTESDGGRLPAVAASGSGNRLEALLATEQGGVSVRIERVDGVERLTITLLPWPPAEGAGVVRKVLDDVPIAGQLR